MKNSNEIVPQSESDVKQSIDFLDKLNGFSSVWRPKLNPGEFFMGAKEVAKNTELSPLAHWAYQYILACNPNDREEMDGFNDVVSWLESNLKIAHASASKLVRELRFHRLLHKFKYLTGRGRFRWKIIFTYVPMDTAEVAYTFAEISGNKLISCELVRDTGNKKSDLTVKLDAVANVQKLDVSDQGCQNGVVANVQNLDVTCSKNRLEKSHAHKVSFNNIDKKNNHNKEDDSASPIFSNGCGEDSEKEEAKKVASQGNALPPEVEEWAAKYPQLENADPETKLFSYRLYKEDKIEPRRNASTDQWAQTIKQYQAEWNWAVQYHQLRNARLVQAKVSYIFCAETGIVPWGDATGWLNAIDMLLDSCNRSSSLLKSGILDALQKKQTAEYSHYKLTHPRSFVNFVKNYEPHAAKNKTHSTADQPIPPIGETGRPCR